MTVTLGHWLSALELAGLDGTMPVTSSLLGSTLPAIHAQARRTLQEAFLEPGASDARVEAVLPRAARGLTSRERRQVRGLAEDVAFDEEHGTPLGWIIVLSEAATWPAAADDPLGVLEAGAAAWRAADAGVDRALSQIRETGPSAWDRRYLAARGYPSEDAAMDYMRSLARTVLRLRAFEATWATMLVVAGNLGMGERDVVALAQTVAVSIGLPTRQVRLPRVSGHRHSPPPGSPG